MQPTRKSIELPSGAKCVIRKLSGRDCVELGDAPSAFPDQTPSSKPSKKQIEFGIALTAVILTKCVSPITFEDKSVKRLTLSDEWWNLDQAKFISLDELDQADADEIVKQVLALSNMTKEASQKARPFPEESALVGEPSPAGQSVSQAA